MRISHFILPCLLLASACGSPVPSSEAPVAPAVEPAPAVPAPSPGAPATSAFTVRGSVTTSLTGDVHTAAFQVVVVDEAGRPAPNVEVQGMFTGGLKEHVVLKTDADGIATATATGGQAHMSVGFTVSGVSYPKDGAMVTGKAITDVIYPSPCCPGRTPPTQ
jgi:hypothetical protein